MDKTIQERQARIEDASQWLEQRGNEAPEIAKDPWFSRANVLKAYARRSMESAEDFIQNGDNFLGGWPDPFES